MKIVEEPLPAYTLWLAAQKKKIHNNKCFSPQKESIPQTNLPIQKSLAQQLKE